MTFYKLQGWSKIMECKDSLISTRLSLLSSCKCNRCMQVKLVWVWTLWWLACLKEHQFKCNFPSSKISLGNHRLHRNSKFKNTVLSKPGIKSNRKLLPWPLKEATSKGRLLKPSNNNCCNSNKHKRWWDINSSTNSNCKLLSSSNKKIKTESHSRQPETMEENRTTEERLNQLRKLTGQEESVTREPRIRK